MILADEINRAPAKVQSALLEAMQERQVTIGDETYPLPEPFLVLATQNPIEQEGTYPLPEAQVDRFMLKVMVGYPTRRRGAADPGSHGRHSHSQMSSPVIITGPLLHAREVVEQIYVDEKIKDYMLELSLPPASPRTWPRDLSPLIAFGASPRASIYLIKAARAHAFMQGRGFVTPEDIKEIAHDVLRHRM